MEPPANGRVEGEQREAVERLHDKLRQSVAALVTSEDWQQALAAAVRFRHYSFANTQLIAAQAAVQGFTPTRVTGYRTWRDLDRQVRRGERGLAILAPIVRNVAGEDGTEEKRKLVGFRPVHVFDISQTDGEPLPEVRPVLLEGDLPAHWDRVADLIVASGFSLHVGDSDRLGEANGITDMVNHQVVVKESLSGAQRFKTAVHELAHVEAGGPVRVGREQMPVFELVRFAQLVRRRHLLRRGLRRWWREVLGQSAVEGAVNLKGAA